MGVGFVDGVGVGGSGGVVSCTGVVCTTGDVVGGRPLDDSASTGGGSSYLNG